MGKASSGRYKNSVRETGRRRINNMTIELTKMLIKEDDIQKIKIKELL